MKYIIHFRYVTPSDYMTPLIYIPKESTMMSGNSKNDAWSNFIKGFPMEQRDWFRCEEIYQSV